jgi:hypothetical protein
MNPWTILAWVLAAAAVLYALHRLALRLERDGWIRYLNQRPDAGAGGGAALGELQKIFEPQTQHVYELKDKKKPRREADSVDPK